YLLQFSRGVAANEVVISSVPVAEIEAKEREIEEARITAAQREAEEFRSREGALLVREHRARRRLVELRDALLRRLSDERRADARQMAARERALGRMFTRARIQLEDAIRRQGGVMRELYGTLQVGQAPAARRMAVDWRHIPQPVEVRCHVIRAVKDKLPRGRYVLLLSVVERLGGNHMHWSGGSNGGGGNSGSGGSGGGAEKHGGRGKAAFVDGGSLVGPRVTSPVFHRGRFFDRSLAVEQSVYELTPAPADLRPANIFLFELFELAGPRNTGGDRPQAWGVLPMCDAHFRVASGRFRVPLMRGPLDRRIKLHRQLQAMVAADLDAWMGNLYLEIRHLPRASR
ncbi:unnamed protein product, partial [Phaeothamnion confervicola]